MARKPATLKQTTGQGFEFENKVAAYSLACLLKDEPLFFREHGGIVRLDFQVRVLGWFMDDILLTSASGQRLALSVKSNCQITPQGFPTEFVKDVWEQYLSGAENPFNPHQDFLGLISSPIDADVNDNLSDMKQWALVMDEDRFIAEVESPQSGNNIKRQLLSSLECPEPLKSNHIVTKADAVKLLRRLQFRQFDFLRLASEDERGVIGYCRDILVSGETHEAYNFWKRLIDIARSYRTSGGYLDFHRLLNELKFEFEIKPWPQYQTDFETIKRHTSGELEAIPDKIGRRVHISRVHDISRIQSQVISSPFTPILGSSGCGKSVLVRKWAESVSGNAPLLWLHGRDIIRQKLGEIENHLKLRHPLEEIANATTAQYAYCVIDSTESIVGDTGFQTLSAFIRALRIGQEGSRWRLILVCQREEWTRISLEVAKFIEYRGKIIEIDSPSFEEMSEVFREFPALSSLALQQGLDLLLRRPKIVDLVASRLVLGDNVNYQAWLGEASIACWHWDTEVAKAPDKIKRAQAMMRIAEVQADNLLADIGISEAPDGTDALLSDCLLSERNNRVAFQHDLYADWTRLQMLIQNERDVVAYINRKLTSPYWNRAVRLYGLYLLEQDTTGSLWKSTLDALAIYPDAASAQDLMLEAIFFASNPEPILAIVWPHLLADQGKLLNRMLGRFLHTATVPNPVRISLGETEVQRTRFATEERVPYWPFWLPILSFFYKNKKEVLRFAPLQIARLSCAWLRHYARTDFAQYEQGGVQSAADFAITLAESMLAKEWSYEANRDETTREAFTAALIAFEQFPDRVRDFVLKASGRVEREEQGAFKFKPSRKNTNTPSSLRQYRRRIENVKPWPDGPVQQANHIFKEICFETPALFPLIRNCPELASEVLLALLIETPPQYEEFGNDPLRHPSEECALDNFTGHYPPFWWHFPWTLFLQIHPSHAIDTILKLVNFATERRAESLSRQKRTAGSLSMFDGERTYTWLGGEQVYLWFTGICGPSAVCSVLMTLEHWLYELLSQNKPVTDFLVRIRDGAKSIAFAGLLVSLSTKYQDLLKDTLRFLLSSSELISLDNSRYVQITSVNPTMIAWSGRHPNDQKAAHEWHTMPHRRLRFQDVSQIMFLNNRDMHPFFAEVCERWKAQEKELRKKGQTDSADTLAFRISVYDLRNYYIRTGEDGQNWLMHQAPQPIKESADRDKVEASFNLLTLTFPMLCRQILNGEKVLTTDAEIESFWTEAQKVIENFDEGYDNVIHSQDTACGVAAVLILQHNDWLLTNCRGSSENVQISIP